MDPKQTIPSGRHSVGKLYELSPARHRAFAILAAVLLAAAAIFSSRTSRSISFRAPSGSLM